MMKWGGKKKNTPTSSSSSSHSSSSPQSLISLAFSRSWFSRFKNVKRNSVSEEGIVKGVGKGKGSSDSPKSGALSGSWNGGRFYGKDDDSYWSLSFRKDRLKSEVGICGLKPGSYNSDDELHSPLRVVSQRRKESGSMERNYGCKVKMDSGKVKVRARRRRGLKQTKPGVENSRIWEEGKEFQRKYDKERVNSTRSVVKDVFDIEVKPGRINSQKHVRRQHSTSFSNSIDLGTIEEGCIFEGFISEQSNSFSEDELLRNQKDKKVDDVMLRNEKQETSLHLRKERQRRRMRMKQSRKVKVFSPRSAAKIECKIKALEDMKQSRMMKMKKETMEETVKKNTTKFDSFAVVKCSVDTEEDFRDSMMEMIREKGIRKPETLEELLACYLSLNCDEYHDLIVKVFREVWLELKQAQFHLELELINCGYL